MAETQEMMDFCAEHNIVSDVEMVNIQDVNAAYDRLQKNDVRYRFVIDIEVKTSPGPTCSRCRSPGCTRGSRSLLLRIAARREAPCRGDRRLKQALQPRVWHLPLKSV
jgi:hypothetical protein